MRGQTELEHNGEDAKASLILPDLVGNRPAKGPSGVQVRLPCRQTFLSPSRTQL